MPDSSPLIPENPTETALRSLSRARQLLACLITSSESFDYPKAKEALVELQQMIRQLAREEARLRALAEMSPEKRAQILEFPRAELFEA